MNKWILYKIFQGCRGFKILINTLLIRSEKENYKLLEISKETLQTCWTSQEGTLLFSADNKYIIFTDGEKETLVLSIHTKAVCVKLPVVLSFTDYSYTSKILAGTTRKGICIYNFNLNNFCEYETEFSVKLVIDDKLLCLSNNKDILTLRNDSVFTLWQFNIAKFGTFKDRKFINKEPEARQREINRVYYHSNKIIVTLSRAIIALNPENGQLLWKIDFENYDPVTLIFDGDKAFSGRLIYFTVIDIEKGIKLFEKDFDPAFRFTIGAFTLSQVRYIGLTLHENHIWFTHEDNGHQFLLKANPENGNIIDGMLLETKSSTYPPVFDENRMYLLDQNGNLYIYSTSPD